MLPLAPLAVTAALVGIGFSIGREIAEKAVIPAGKKFLADLEGGGGGEVDAGMLLDDEPMVEVTFDDDPAPKAEKDELSDADMLDDGDEDASWAEED